MIHAYFTSGMFDNAEIFLKSLHKTNGDLFRVVMTTRDLGDNQIKRLKSFYPGLEVENKTLDMERLAKSAGVSTNDLCRYRNEVENQYVTPENKVWKLMIAGEDRPRAIYDLLLRGEGTVTPIIHFDIDALFRKSVWPIMTDALTHDCGLLLRAVIKPIKARITISTMTWRRTRMSLKFFERWMYWLDVLPPSKRPIGYGQISCWYAFEELKNELDYYILPPVWGYPGNNKDNHIIWSGAIHKLSKEDCVKKFKEEMENLR
jgi:hypothetical protein